MLVTWDAMAWAVALVLYVGLRHDFVLTRPEWAWTLGYLAAVVALQAAIGHLTHIYLGRSRVGSFSEAVWVGSVVLLIAVVLGAALHLLDTPFPRGIAVAVPGIALILMAAGRSLFRMVFDTANRHSAGDDAVPALVYGAGEAGHQLALLIDKSSDAHYAIRGFVDDDPAKRFLRIQGHRVLGNGDDLAEVARREGARVVILAVTKASASLMQTVSDQCDLHGLDLVVLPPVREMIGGQISLEALREFNVDDLLGRRPVKTDLSSIADYVAGKVVLVTGAGGSIGSELARQVNRLRPSKLVLLDRDESALHAVQLSLYGVGLLDTDDMVLCDIRDHDALSRVFEHHRPDVVFHAAALKHLPMLEQYPDEGWKTNVLGSLNVLRCAHEVGVADFVNISTDKAADASCVLGRTKRIAERLTAWYANEYGVPYVSVRFGNVLGSRGSVLHTFRSQIERGGPITVTDPDVTRYFMTIPEACELVMQAGAIGNPGDVLVLDMGEPVRIVDVAERLIAESGKRIAIEYTGLRPGEKLHEVLFSDLEEGTPSAHPLISQVRVSPVDPASVKNERPTHEQVVGLLAQEPQVDRTSQLDDSREVLV